MENEEAIKILLEVMTQQQIDAIISFGKKAFKKGWDYSGEFYKEGSDIIMVWACDKNKHWLCITSDGALSFKPVTMTCF